LTQTADKPHPIRDVVPISCALELWALADRRLGGPNERELVTERGWLTKDEMREVIAVCQSLPGPLAIQVGIFISYFRGAFGEPGPGVGASSCRIF